MDPFPFDIVGFDLDGTLCDTSADLGAALNHALALAGRAPVPDALVPKLIGGGAAKMLRRALDQSGGTSGAEFAVLFQAQLAFYRQNIAVHTQLYPGGAAMLDALARRGVKLAVVTNKLEALAHQLFDQMGISSRFATIIGGDTLGPGRAKPARDLIDLMIERLGGGRAVFVGDSTFDIGAARAAGIPSVAVSFGFNDRPADELGADAVIGHFGELVACLERLGRVSA